MHFSLIFKNIVYNKNTNLPDQSSLATSLYRSPKYSFPTKEQLSQSKNTLNINSCLPAKNFNSPQVPLIKLKMAYHFLKKIASLSMF